jgi:hypothetical protein
MILYKEFFKYCTLFANKWFNILDQNPETKGQKIFKFCFMMVSSYYFLREIIINNELMFDKYYGAIFTS